MKLCHMIWRVVALSAVAATFLRVVPAQALAEGNPKNGLSSKAFRDNALTTDKRALEYLVTYSLHDLFSPTAEADDDQAKTARELVGRSLQDSKARAVAEELVRCALNKDTELSYTYRKDRNSPPTVGTWKGEMGLCQGWHTTPPDLACQQIVTACLMARVNALNAAVPISLRGAKPVHPPRDKVHTEMTIRESPAPQPLNKGTPIPASDWSAAYVGKCSNEKVRLTLRSSSTNRASELRICAGIHGCESGPNASWALRGASDLRYKHLGDFSSKNTSKTMSVYEFSCPTALLVRGFYSVMVKNAEVFAIKNAGSPDMYPATETVVFGWLEGAFFGNLFDPDKLDLQGKPEGLPYTDVHACYSLDERRVDPKLGVAYLNDRICANRDCFPNLPEPCSKVCKLDTTTGTFVDCQAKVESSKVYQPITTYLNEPCDLIKDTELCDKVRYPAPGRGRGPDRGTGCGRARGCSSGGGALQMLPGVAVLGLLLRRRRRRRLSRAG